VAHGSRRCMFAANTRGAPLNLFRCQPRNVCCFATHRCRQTNHLRAGSAVTGARPARPYSGMRQCMGKKPIHADRPRFRLFRRPLRL